MSESQAVIEETVEIDMGVTPIEVWAVIPMRYTLKLITKLRSRGYDAFYVGFGVGAYRGLDAYGGEKAYDSFRFPTTVESDPDIQIHIMECIEAVIPDCSVMCAGF